MDLTQTMQLASQFNLLTQATAKYISDKLNRDLFTRTPESNEFFKKYLNPKPLKFEIDESNWTLKHNH